MIFLGTTFFSGKYTLNAPAAHIPNINTICLADGTYDHMFVSKDPTLTINNIHDDWDFNTVMNASYEKSPDGGNSGFSLLTTDTVVVKCREKGTLDWLPIYTKKINTVHDFAISEIDYYRKSNADYEYMLVSTINGMENSYAIAEIRSEFDGMYVVDKNNIYGTIYDLNGCDTTRNVNTSLLELLNDTYPSVIANGDSDYNTGSVTGSFIKVDESTDTLSVYAGIAYRKQVIDWLCNRKPKILKFPDGRIWMIKVMDKPTDVMRNHPDLRQISFTWAEIGDVNNPKALYHNNLSDVGVEWW